MSTLVKKRIRAVSWAVPLGSLACAIAALVVPASSHAQGFSAVVSPPRIEVALQPGKSTRQVIEITHVANQRGNYRVYTNDWKLNAEGNNAVFSDELAPDSCRPWVVLETRELALAPNGKVRFRFDIEPPADTVARECRFAIMVEGTEQVVKTEGAVSFPVSGRIGVIVYASVGGASPQLEITQAGTGIRDGIVLPQVQVRNTGNAHGRLGGFLVATDPEGRQIDFVPESLPVLPGQSRLIPLVPNVPGTETFKPSYPLTIKGNIEWGNQKTTVDFRYDSPAAKLELPPAKAPQTSPAKPSSKEASPLVPRPAAK